MLDLIMKMVVLGKGKAKAIVLKAWILTHPNLSVATVNNFTVGNRFTVGNHSLRVHKLRVKRPTTYTGRCVLWSDAGVNLGQVTITGVPGEWVEEDLPTPVVLNANTTYIVSLYSTAHNRYNAATDMTFNGDATFVRGRYVSGDTFPTTNNTAGFANPVDFVYEVIE